VREIISFRLTCAGEQEKDKKAGNIEAEKSQEVGGSSTKLGICICLVFKRANFIAKNEWFRCCEMFERLFLILKS